MSGPSRKEHLQIGCEICYALASQLPARGPTGVDDPPAPHVNNNKKRL